MQRYRAAVTRDCVGRVVGAYSHDTVFVAQKPSGNQRVDSYYEELGDAMATLASEVQSKAPSANYERMELRNMRLGGVASERDCHVHGRTHRSPGPRYPCSKHKTRANSRTAPSLPAWQSHCEENAAKA